MSNGLTIVAGIGMVPVFNLARDFRLVVWVVTALTASVTTGSLVGVLVSSRLRTYQLVVWIFLGAAVTWLCTAFVSGAAVQFLLEALLLNQYLLFGILASLLLLAVSYGLVRLGDTYRAIRWSILGALAAWAVGTIGTAIAYRHLTQTLSVLPENFWGSLMFSMAISTILGACGGGMIFRHRQLWRI
jgi:hypothetical protein